MTLSFGSKLTYRLWGTWFLKNKEVFPFKVFVTAAAKNGSETVLTAEAVSDEGAALTRVSSAAIAFENRMLEALLELRSQ